MQTVALIDYGSGNLRSAEKALREAARMRLFMRSSWLERDLRSAIEQYATGIHIDVAGIEEAARSVDPMNPESMQEALSGGMFIPEPTGTQKAALERLELTLALIEGWVDVVVTEAARPLESNAALRETINRRRASGGPAEHAFGTLVGLDLRPRRLREAAALTQEELAQLVGASRETVNKALAEFVQRGWIRLEARAVVILNLQRLQQRSR